MNRLLVVGSSGADVRELQALLNQRPPSAVPPLNVDGIFGPKTAARVREFQKHNGLSVDGIVGPQTWAALRKSQAPPAPEFRQGTLCGNTDPTNLGRAQAIEQALLAGLASGAISNNQLAFRQGSGSAFVGGLGIPGIPSLPSLPSVRSLTAAQIATATTVFGSSINFAKVFISDASGLQNRPFTVAINKPAILGGAVQVINCGTFSPSTSTLIHELTHVWQSQHHANPTEFMTNAAGSQGLAVAQSTAVATIDPSVKANTEWPAQFPFSAYAYKPGKAFGDYAAEQIANQVESGVSAIVSHVKSVAAGAIDSNNTTSLSTLRTDDRRAAGVVI